MSTFYKSFKKDLKRAAEGNAELQGRAADRRRPCDKCGEGEMVEKAGKFGIFLACSRYPDCDNTKELEPAEAADRRARRDLRELRPADGRQARPLRDVPRLHRLSRVQDDAEDHRDQAGRRGRQAGSDPRREVPELRQEPRHQAGPLRRVHGVHGISRVQVRQAEVRPACVCPKDGGDVVERKSRRGKVFYGCANYPKCDFTLWNKPMLEPCPKCGWTFLTEKITKRHGRQLICANEECDYVRSAELEEATVGA